ncbi:MAG: FAD-binding oxidoreductase [Candidatus Microbacterium colombiense]|nr:MAG: FAD-binding oxidoreductase [Microbacterium sp.]
MPRFSALEHVRGTLTGSLLVPTDEGFDTARRPWNLAIDQHPVAVSVPADVADLRALLEAAADDGVPVSVQPGGHGASGSLTGALLVRMAAFDDLDIDLESGTARIGAGVRWGRVVDALEGTGWVAPAGTSPVVSVTGYTLGGGHSWFSRTAGLGSDNLRAAWVLRTDGTHERVDDESEPDLMWALRGAGGIVGIVTAIEIDLVPAPTLWGTSLVFDASDAPTVLRAVRDLSAHAPATLNVFTNSMRMPDVPQLPPEIRGRSFVTVQALSVAGDADALLRALRSSATARREVVGATSPARLSAQSTEPTEPTASRGASVALAELDDATIDALITYRDRPEQATIIGIDVRMLGGALDAPRREGFASLEGAAWIAYALAPLFPDAPREPGDLSLSGFRELLAPAKAQRTVPTFLSPDENLEHAAPDADIERLRAVRARLDPSGLLHEGRLPR